LKISMDVYNGDHLGTGHHPHYCTIGLRKSPPSWQQPGVILFQRMQDGSIQLLGQIDQGGAVTGAGYRTAELSMGLGRWYHLEFELWRADNKQSATITIDDGESVQGPATFTIPGPAFASFDQLELTAQEDDVWYDNIAVEPLSPNAIARKAKEVPDLRVRTVKKWADDFESYTAGPGTWPETWIDDANAWDHDASYVDGETFKDTHGKTLRLHADDMGWSAHAFPRVNLRPSFRASFDVYSTQGYMGTALWEKPTWTARALGLFYQWPGEVGILDRCAEKGPVTPGIRTDKFKIAPNKWHHVELAVRQESGAQTVTVSVSDGESQQGPDTFHSPRPSPTAFAFWGLSTHLGTVWYDNVTVEPLAK
jgi:hypothetical protein